MDYRILIAKRYVAGRRRISLISVITAISAMGVTTGVAALIVVLSVMNGFYDVVRDLLVTVDPHVRIVGAQGRGLNEDVVRLTEEALDIPEVKLASAYVEGKALLVHGGLGYLKSSPIEMLYRDARLNWLEEGTPTIHKLIIARALLQEEVETFARGEEWI